MFLDSLCVFILITFSSWYYWIYFALLVLIALLFVSCSIWFCKVYIEYQTNCLFFLGWLWTMILGYPPETRASQNDLNYPLGHWGTLKNQQSPSDSLYHFVPLGTLQTVVIMGLQSGFTALHRAASETKSPTPGSHHLSSPLSAAPDIVHLMVGWGQYKGGYWPIDFSKQQFHKLEYAGPYWTHISMAIGCFAGMWIKS